VDREQQNRDQGLAIVVVGGSAKDVGKTALVCGVIAALPEFRWTAVKISGHDYEPGGTEALRRESSNPAIWEEMLAGPATDTERYLAAGARRALLVTRIGAEIPVEEIRIAIGEDRNVIFESNRIVGAVKPDLVLALVGDSSAEMKASFQRLLRVADAVVTVGNSEANGVPEGVPRFDLDVPDRLPPAMVSWLRVRLGTSR
jgi:hypothetical protein